MRSVRLVLIVPLLVAGFPALIAGDCGGCSTPAMDCCAGKSGGCDKERAQQVEALGCCAPRELPEAPATDTIPAPASDVDRLHVLSTALSVDAKNGDAPADDRSAPQLPRTVPLFTFHSVLLI